MLFGSLRFVLKGWVTEFYINPEFHFTYFGFEWIRPLAGAWMYLPFILMILACVGIIFGAFYRMSSIVFFLAFTYVELLDKTFYLNHYYFVSLVAFILCFLPANADFSVDVKRKPEYYRSEVSAWQVWIIKLQLAIVYFFAGVAKIQSDWLLEAQPLKIWLQAYRDMPLLGGVFASAWLAYFFSWFGCIYDLTIPFFLSFKRTRNIAYLFVIVFHIVTWLLFPIGVFPWVMICATLIFFSATFHEQWLSKVKKIVAWRPREIKTRKSFSRKTILLPLSLYLIVQLLLPFRYLAYPGELFWHEQGFRFSWRVMLMHKEGYATFYVQDRATGRNMEIDNAHYLTPAQEDQMATQPDFILQYAHHLERKYKDTLFRFGTEKFQLKDPSVHAEIYVSLNGRPSRLFVDRKIDLTAKRTSFARNSWIEPF